MLITVILFWLSFITLFFCYIGYGLLLFLINAFKKSSLPAERQTEPTDPIPVTIIVPAYNEIGILEAKIKNTLEIDYPADKLKIIFVTDGSGDGSDTFIRQYPSISLLHQPERQGKMAAIKRAMQHVKTPVVVFSDANALLNKDCIQRIVQWYSNPDTGGVAGEKRIISSHGSPIGEAEGIYWNYESFMKKQDADFNSVVGAAGELYSIRTELFPAINDDVILDDFVISMKVCLQGYKIRYEPRAYARELPSASIDEEQKRKIRISAGAYQSIGLLRGALDFASHPALSFQYSIRRLLRWTVCPYMLFVMLLSNALLVISHDASVTYRYFFSLQLLFYVAAAGGWLVIRAGKRIAILTIPFYFVFMNYCQVRGFFRFLSRKQTVLWERSTRQVND